VTEDHEQHPFRVGLTGGIASGKSSVADLFAALGVAVIDTDVIARELVQPGEAALGDIQQRFGESLIDATGNLDRAAMRKLVFADDCARLDLEAILHPRIGAEVKRQAATAAGHYQIIVVPLLVSSPLLKFVNRVLAVDCDEDTQIARLLLRDTETVEQARRILAAQASREDRLAIADDVISNDGTLDDTAEQVRELHRQYLTLS